MTKKLRLREGAYYRTRDGRKAGPAKWASENMWWLEVPGEDAIRSFNDDGTRFGCQTHSLDLVAEWVDGDATPYDERTTAPTETELERLVRVANEGEAAHAKLTKLYRQNEAVEYVSGEHLYVPMIRDSARWRTKPRPTFPEFRVGPDAAPKFIMPRGSWDVVQLPPEKSWLVRLDGETLHVGCQSFPAHWVRIGLAGLCRQRVTQSDGMTPMVAARDCIRWGAYELSWADADRILAALEAYFAAAKEAK